SRTSTHWWCTSRSPSCRRLHSFTSSLGSPVVYRWRGRVSRSSSSEPQRQRSRPARASTPRTGSWWRPPSARRSSTCTSGGCCAWSERVSCSRRGRSWVGLFLAAAGRSSCSCFSHSSLPWSGAPTSAVAWCTTTTRAATPAGNPSSSPSSGGRQPPRLEDRREMSDTSAMRFETLAYGYGLIEGPRVDGAGNLYFSDVTNGGVYRRRPDGSIDTVVPKRRGVGGIALHADGGLVISGKNICHVKDGT